MRSTRGSLSCSLVAAAALASALLASTNSYAAAPDCSNPAALEPQGIVGKGPNGEPAASPDAVALSAEDAAKVKKGNFKVGLVFQFMNDWSRDQIAGLTATFNKYDVKIIGTTEAQFKVPKQISDIENMITLKPDRNRQHSRRRRRNGADLRQGREGWHQACLHGQCRQRAEFPQGLSVRRFR